MNEAYESSDPKRALRLLENLAARLEDEHPAAAASLREGLAETLTVIELGLVGWLRFTQQCMGHEFRTTSSGSPDAISMIAAARTSAELLRRPALTDSGFSVGAAPIQSAATPNDSRLVIALS